MDGKGHSGEVSNRNKKHVIGNWGKRDSCYEVAKNLAELCSCSILWKAELVSNNIGYLTDMISKKVVKVWLGSSWQLTVKFKETERT